MPPKSVQRIIGLLLLPAMLGLTAWAWHILQTEGYYYTYWAALPAFAIFSLAFIFFPIDREELLAKHGVEKPQSFEHYPPPWKVLTVLALAAAVGSFFLMSTQ